MHLAYKSYGPYAANNKLVTDQKILDIGEYYPANYSKYDSSLFIPSTSDRLGNINNLLKGKTFQKWLKLSSNIVPLIIFGDFNSPSHLDWIESTK